MHICSMLQVLNLGRSYATFGTKIPVFRSNSECLLGTKLQKYWIYKNVSRIVNIVDSTFCHNSFFTLNYRSLQSKHSQEVLLLESVKSFFKQRFALEKQHFESLSKICATQYKTFDCLKRLPPNENNDVSNFFPYSLVLNNCCISARREGQ